MSWKPSFIDCPSQNLDVFSPPMVHSDIDYFKDVEYFPQTAAIGTSKQTSVFDIPAQTDHLTDPYSSYFKIKCQILRAGKTSIATTLVEKVGVVNQLAHSLFRQVELVLNDTPVTDSNGMYAYQAYIETILSYDETYVDQDLALVNWASDTAKQEDAPFPKAGKNVGLNNRSDNFDNSTWVTLICKPRVNVCNQKRYLLNGVRQQWRLTPNSNEFCLMKEVANTSILSVGEVTLVLRHIHAKEPLLTSIERNLLKVPAQYPIVHPQMATYLIPSGAATWQQDGIFNGRVPNRIFFGLVLNSSFNGKNDENPFDFKHLDVKQIRLTIDGQEPCPSLKMDFDKYQGLEGYHRLLSCLNNSPSLISNYAFHNGSTIYGFDLTPKGNCMNEQFVLQRQGNIRLELSFGTVTTALCNLVVLGEFDGVITIDSKRNVMRSW